MDHSSKAKCAEGSSAAPSLRVCLAGSGGGHLRQLIDLEPAWSTHDYFFLTEDTALSRSLSEKHRTHFVPHLALGQARLGRPVTMVRAAISSFVKSAGIMLRERPDVVVSTGAGAVFFGVLWARLLGAKVVVVESFARFDRPSLFGRLAAPFAHHKVVQSPQLAPYWPDASVFDPLKLLGTPRPVKKPLLFATVGAILPFDRLVNGVAQLKSDGQIPEDVIMQVGAGGAKPVGIECHETLSFERIQQILLDADIVVCHGGTGSLITALRAGCRIVAVPRLFREGEVYDDHQAEITRAFAERGLIDVSETPDDLAFALQRARAREPVLATSDPTDLIGFLQRLFETMDGTATEGAPQLVASGS